MSPHLDELYLQWLYGQVGDVERNNPARTHWSLLRQLFKKEFVWFVPNDDNRIEDGRDLRIEFLEQQALRNVDPAWLDLGCSMLELLIGLSRRLEFEGDGDARDWFWLLIDNLGFTTYSDQQYKISDKERVVDEVLDRVIWRNYNRDGSDGGLFPLRRATRDQRKIELWYQLSSYLLERN